MQLSAREEQDGTRRRQNDELLRRPVIYRARPRLLFLRHLCSRRQTLGVVSVGIKGVRGVRYRSTEALKVEGHGVVFTDGEDGEPPVELLGRRAVPGVPMPRKGKRHPGG